VVDGGLWRLIWGKRAHKAVANGKMVRMGFARVRILAKFVWEKWGKFGWRQRATSKTPLVAVKLQ
jgi:hypothetical protein